MHIRCRGLGQATTDSHSSRTGSRNLHFNQKHTNTTHHTPLPYSGGVNAGSLHHRENKDLVNSTGAGTCFSELNIPVRSVYICYSCNMNSKNTNYVGT